MSAAAKWVDGTGKQRRDRSRAEYDGFISYSHAVDGRLAPALQSGLQRFAKPWYRLRSLRIFRDDASLAANPALWSAIEDALSRSRWFILLASPTAASSRWVAREAEYWLAHRSIDHLLVVLSEGDLAWDEALHRFNPSRTNALPQPLLTAFEQEPRWIDVRWAQSRDDLTLRDTRFRAAVAELAAPIHGREKDELTGEDVRQHRRTMRLARAAITGLAALAAAASVAAVLAVRGQNAARAQRDRAEEQARLATSRQLAAQSDIALRENELDLALLLSARAFSLRDTAEAWDALVGALNAAPRLERIIHTPVGTHRAISADGRAVAAVGTDHRLHMRNLETGAQDTRAISVEGQIVGLGISNEGKTVAVGDRQGAVAIHDLRRSGPARRFPPLRAPPGEEGPFQGTRFAIAPRDELVAWNGAQISLWDGRQQRRLSPGVKPGSWLLAFDGEGRRLAAASDSDGTVVVWRLHRGRPVGRAVSFNAGSGRALGGFGEGVAAISFSPVDANLLAIGGFDGTVAFWNADSAKLLMKRQGGRAPAGSLAFTHDGRLLAASGAATTIWDVHRRRRVDVLPRYGGSGPAAFLAESQRLATGGARAVAVWNLSGSPSHLARTLAGPNARIQRVTYDASRNAFATLDVDGAIRFWDESTLRPLVPTRSFGWEAIDLAVSPDGGTVAAWRPFRRPPLTLWYPDQRKRRHIYEIPDVYDVAFTQKGEPVAATSGSGRIELWRTSPPRVMRGLNSSRDAGGVHLAAGAVAAAASTREGAEVTLWNAETGAVVRRVPDADAVGFGFSPDGRILATSNWRDSTITLWDAKSGANRGRLMGATAVDALALDADGRRLAALTEPDTIRFWQLGVRERRGSVGLVARARGRFEDERQMAFSSDGRKLFVIGLGSRPLVFNVDERTWPEVACRIAGRGLTRAEWLRYVGTGFAYEPTCV